MRPSEELGSPSLALNIEVSRSPSQVGDWTPLWENMSLPSSPSPKVSESNMDLNRYAKRGFSEDLALPPRQIEKPFRFLDLPAEIRNMIYELTFDQYLGAPYCDWYCRCPSYGCCYRHDGCRVYLNAMKRQCRLPSIASVNKCLRVEFVSLYYATTEFTWYWDPLKVYCDVEDFPLAEAIDFFTHVLDFATNNGIQIKGITVCSPRHCQGYAYSLQPIAKSVRFLARLRKSLSQTGKVHPMVREFKFEDTTSLASRLFNFSGSLKPSVLRHHQSLSRELRYFLRADSDGRGMLWCIEDIEAQEWEYNLAKRRERKEEARADNKAKGLARWTGVLRSRSAKAQG
ncbi:hypothetical protein KCU65_g7987, partial [Aureobasidium melanogenum]